MVEGYMATNETRIQENVLTFYKNSESRWDLNCSHFSQLSKMGTRLVQPRTQGPASFSSQDVSISQPVPPVSKAKLWSSVGQRWGFSSA